jgi:hypothetical protein
LLKGPISAPRGELDREMKRTNFPFGVFVWAGLSFVKGVEAQDSMEVNTAAAIASPGTVLDIISRLDRIVRAEIADLFQGNESVSASVPVICQDISSVLQTLFDQPELLDLSSETSVLFLKSTLPVLVEVIVRRKNKP